VLFQSKCEDLRRVATNPVYSQAFTVRASPSPVCCY